LLKLKVRQRAVTRHLVRGVGPTVTAMAPCVDKVCFSDGIAKVFLTSPPGLDHPQTQAKNLDTMPRWVVTREDGEEAFTKTSRLEMFIPRTRMGYPPCQGGQGARDWCCEKRLTCRSSSSDNSESTSAGDSDVVKLLSSDDEVAESHVSNSLLPSATRRIASRVQQRAFLDKTEVSYLQKGLTSPYVTSATRTSVMMRNVPNELASEEDAELAAVAVSDTAPSGATGGKRRKSGWTRQRRSRAVEKNTQ